MSTMLEGQFHDAMLAVYLTAKREAGYNATRFLAVLKRFMCAAAPADTPE